MSVVSVIHREELPGVTFDRLPSGLKCLVRMSSGTTRPEQGALDQVVPQYGQIAPILLAYHTGGDTSMTEGISGPTIILTVTVRHGDGSGAVLDNYLKLLSRFLEAMPKYNSEMIRVLDHVKAWGRDLNPANRPKL